MKSKYFLTSFLILFTAFAFGQDTKQKLDSSVTRYWSNNSNEWTGGGKRDFFYDTNENLAEWHKYSLDGGSIWILHDKEEFTWDAENKMTQMFHSNWDGTSWSLSFKEEYSYDDNSNLTQTVRFVMFGSTLEPTWRENSFYDENNNKILEYRAEWDSNFLDWFPYSRYEFSYDINNNLIQLIDYYNDPDWNWQQEYKTEFVYDDNTNLINITESIWYSYWENFRKHDYSYNVNNNETQNVLYIWNYSESQWELGSKLESTFNSSDILENKTRYLWDSSTNTWVAEKKSDYDYNGSYLYTDLILPYYLNSTYFRHMLNDRFDFEWDVTMNDWIPVRKELFYFSEEVTSVSEINKVDLNVYPNPFTKYVTFSNSDNHGSMTFELLDLQGRRIMSQEIRSDEKVNMEGLNEGLYFYNLIIDGEKVSGKLMKQ